MWSYPLALAVASVSVALLERLDPARPAQRALRRGLWSDALYLVFNGHFLGVGLAWLAARTSEDPLGLDLSGQVSLLGAADSKGKQKTLSKGDFNGGFTRTEGGDLTLGGVDKNDVQSKGDILIGGEPIDFEKTDTNGDGVIEAPPVVFYKPGTGTRSTASNTNQTQSAQLL